MGRLQEAMNIQLAASHPRREKDNALPAAHSRPEKAKGLYAIFENQ